MHIVYMHIVYMFTKYIDAHCLGIYIYIHTHTIYIHTHYIYIYIYTYIVYIYIVYIFTKYIFLVNIYTISHIASAYQPFPFKKNAQNSHRKRIRLQTRARKHRCTATTACAHTCARDSLTRACVCVRVRTCSLTTFKSRSSKDTSSKDTSSKDTNALNSCSFTTVRLRSTAYCSRTPPTSFKSRSEV